MYRKGIHLFTAVSIGLGMLALFSLQQLISADSAPQQTTTPDSETINDDLDAQLVWKFEADQRIQLVAWHPQSDLIAVSTQEFNSETSNYVILIDSESGQEVRRIKVDEDQHTADMAWNSDGSLFAVGDAYGWVHVFDGNWEEITLFFVPWFTSLDWHPLKNELITVNDTETSTHAFSNRQITVWNVSGEIVNILTDLENVNDAEFSSDGRFLVGIDGYIRGMLWDAETYTSISAIFLDSHPRTLNDSHASQSITWSFDNQEIGILSNNNTEGIFSFVVWDVLTQQTVTEISGADSFLYSLDWHPYANLLASGWGDGTVQIWDMDSYENVLILQDTEHITSSVAWSPDGQFLASVALGGVVRLWKIDLPNEE